MSTWGGAYLNKWWKFLGTLTVLGLDNVILEVYGWRVKEGDTEYKW